MARKVIAFCVFVDTLLEGSVPAVRGADGKPYVFATRLEAEREIADNVITRLSEFLEGERDFDDAMAIEEYIVEVMLLADGSIVDSKGTAFVQAKDESPGHVKD